MPNGTVENMSLTHAFERVLHTTQQAFIAQFKRLRIEAEEDLTSTLEGSAYLFAGFLVVSIAWISFMALSVHLLRRPLSLAASLAIVGCVNLLVGSWLIATSVRALRRMRLLRPDAEGAPAEVTKAAILGATIAEQREAVQPIIEKTEEELKQTIEDLSATIQNRLDFSKRIVERPLPWLVGSLLVGFLLAQPRAR